MCLPVKFGYRMEIYVIRHTRVVANSDVCYGQSDVPLADTFLSEAEAYKKKLPNDFDAVFSSPSSRCQMLADFLLFQPTLYENALLEMNFGEWEGKKWTDIAPTELDNWMKNFVSIRTPHGESLSEVFARVKSFLDKLREASYQKVLFITHAGVIRCIWAYLLEIPLRNIFKISIGYGEVFVVELGKTFSLDKIRQAM